MFIKAWRKPPGPLHLPFMSLSVIACLALAAWIYLLFRRSGFWRADQRLKDAPIPNNWPEIVAVIPARNEAETIGEVAAAHLACDYPGRFSIILVDDGSTDGTADIARRAVEETKTAKAESDARAFTVLTAPEKPDGWSGKLWAVHNGLAEAREDAPGAEYVLLTDADIVAAPDALRRLVAKAEAEGLALASLMARLDARAPWGGILIPAFIYFFQKLYPFARVNDPADNAAAAAGGFMLVRADALGAVNGVESLKGDLIDDCALARRVKDISPTTKIWLGLAGDEAASRRDNRSLGSVWNMVARTAYAQLGFSPLLLAGTLLGMGLIYLSPPLIALTLVWHESVAAVLIGLTAWGLMAYSYWPTLKLYGREPWEASLLPFAAGLYTAMTLSSAMRHWRGEGGRWKGRTYPGG